MALLARLIPFIASWAAPVLFASTRKIRNNLILFQKVYTTWKNVVCRCCWQMMFRGLSQSGKSFSSAAFSCLYSSCNNNPKVRNYPQVPQKRFQTEPKTTDDTLQGNEGQALKFWSKQMETVLNWLFYACKQAVHISFNTNTGHIFFTRLHKVRHEYILLKESGILWNLPSLISSWMQNYLKESNLFLHLWFAI